MERGGAKQMRIDEVLPVDYPKESFDHILKLARTKYRNDPNVQAWLKIYEKGTADLIVKKGKKKNVLNGIHPRSEFARMGLERAVLLRECGKVMHRAKQPLNHPTTNNLSFSKIASPSAPPRQTMEVR